MYKLATGTGLVTSTSTVLSEYSSTHTNTTNITLAYVLREPFPFKKKRLSRNVPVTCKFMACVRFPTACHTLF